MYVVHQGNFLNVEVMLQEWFLASENECILLSPKWNQFVIHLSFISLFTSHLGCCHCCLLPARSFLTLLACFLLPSLRLLVGNWMAAAKRLAEQANCLTARSFLTLAAAARLAEHTNCSCYSFVVCNGPCAAWGHCHGNIVVFKHALHCLFGCFWNILA